LIGSEIKQVTGWTIPVIAMTVPTFHWMVRRSPPYRKSRWPAGACLA
jgi:hypothetical protein